MTLNQIQDQLVDLVNAAGELEAENDKTLAAHFKRLEGALDAALRIAGETIDYAEVDHEQAASDRDWEQRLDEARGK